jgi:hypothetical protein
MPTKNRLIESYNPRLKVGELPDDHKQAAASKGGMRRSSWLLAIAVNVARLERPCAATIPNSAMCARNELASTRSDEEPAQDDTPGISNAVDLKDTLRKVQPYRDIPHATAPFVASFIDDHVMASRGQKPGPSTPSGHCACNAFFILLYRESIAHEQVAISNQQD